MAQGDAPHSLAAADCVAELPAHSHVWRQDHNGFSHQDPGFIDHVVNKKAEVIRVYLPPDANSLLSVTDHCLRSRNYVNVIVAGKQPEPQWLTWTKRSNIARRARHLGMGQQRRGRRTRCGHGLRGDVPTLETLAAVELVRQHSRNSRFGSSTWWT